MRIPFSGGAYAGISPNVDVQEMYGFYPEFDPKDTRTPKYAVPSPSLTTAFTVTGAQRIDALHYVNGSLYAIDSVGGVYGMNSAGAFQSLLGTLPNYSAGIGYPVVIDNGAVNGHQMLIFDGQHAWAFDTNTNAITQLDGTAPWQNITPTYITQQDTFGIVSSLDSTGNPCVFWLTNSFNYKTIGGLNFAQPQTILNRLVTVMSDNIRLYLLGDVGLEVWYNSGDPNFTFTRIPGAVFPVGCSCSNSVVKVDNGIIWVGPNEWGGVSVFQMRGIQPPQRISTTQLDYQITKALLATPSLGLGSVFAFAYKDNGHEFYNLAITPFGTPTTIPISFVFDTTTTEWHKRNWDVNSHVFIPLSDINTGVGKHYFAPGALSGGTNNRVLVMGTPSNADGQSRYIISPHFNDMQKPLVIDALQVNFNNLDTNITPSGTMTLSWSKNDNNFQATGNNTGGSTTFTVGSQPRFMARRLGWARDWVFKLDCSSMAVPPIIMDGFATLADRTEGSPGTPG